jgi:4-diphosphocytidyl-2-C-methyl-D-erythritol kinase
MATLIEEARAKVNLTLGVLGRRGDGYHELESLVVFARAADRLTLRIGEPFSLTLTGPSAAKVEGENLVATAVERARAADPDLVAGAFELEKNLPVAAGIGGGSADAAAALRLIQRANPDRAAAIDWLAIATGLGADVPVCLAGRPSLMRGLGERVSVLASLPRLSLVLINPGLPLSAGAVFRELGARPFTGHAGDRETPAFAGLDDLVAYLRAHPNDLELPAIALCPAIASVKAALERAPGALLARMSGSGPTCYAAFASRPEADAAAADIKACEPAWWVEATDVAD